MHIKDGQQQDYFLFILVAMARMDMTIVTCYGGMHIRMYVGVGNVLAGL